MAFGKPKVISGSAGEFQSTMVPLEWVQNINNPIPITGTGTGNVTFTLNASTTNPVCMFVGNDFFLLQETLAYTWVAGTNTILDSTGATASLTGSTLGVWYFYVGIVSGTVTLYPSQTAPSFVQHTRQAGFLGHPGTSRTEYWRYVGVQICTTAATPVFLELTKHAKSKMYTMATVSFTTPSDGIQAKPDYTPSMPLYVPKHGVKLKGIVSVGPAASTSVKLGTTSGTPSTTGPLDFFVKNYSCLASVGHKIRHGFNNIVANANGKIFVQQSILGSAPVIIITGFEDVV